MVGIGGTVRWAELLLTYYELAVSAVKPTSAAPVSEVAPAGSARTEHRVSSFSLSRNQQDKPLLSLPLPAW